MRYAHQHQANEGNLSLSLSCPNPPPKRVRYILWLFFTHQTRGKAIILPYLTCAAHEASQTALFLFCYFWLRPHSLLLLAASPFHVCSIMKTVRMNLTLSSSNPTGPPLIMAVSILTIERERVQLLRCPPLPCASSSVLFFDALLIVLMVASSSWSLCRR